MYRKYGKRILDILISVFALPFVLLASLVIAPLIWLEDRGPVLYTAPRLGKGGKTFMMYKFRSMYVNAPDIRNEDGSTYNASNDPRVTRVGRVLRMTSLDELPQFINVLKGEMSIVGPRPDLPDAIETVYLENEIERLAAKPGITGYSQAYYRNTYEMRSRIQNDITYIRNISFILDAKIIFKTAITILQRKGIYH